MTKAKKAPKKTKASKKKTTKKTAKVTQKKVAASKTVKKQPARKRSAKVSYLPKGYSIVTPYLIVDNASAAIKFYIKVFGAKEVMRMEQQGGKVGHAELQIGDSKIMLADEYPEIDAHSPNTFGGTPVGIHLYTKNVDDVVNRAVSSGATLLRPIEDMFYGDRSASLQDPFGHKWHVSTHIENVTPAQMRKRAAALFGKK